MDDTEKAVRDLFERHGKSYWLRPQFGHAAHILRWVKSFPDLDLATLELAEVSDENGSRFYLYARLSNGAEVLSASAKRVKQPTVLKIPEK